MERRIVLDNENTLLDSNTSPNKRGAVDSNDRHETNLRNNNGGPSGSRP
jgi:hypothetical protein